MDRLINLVFVGVIAFCLIVIGIRRMWLLKFSMWLFMKRRPKVWKTRWQDDLRWTGCILLIIVLLAFAIWGVATATY